VDDAIPLEDLAPSRDVTGGAGKLLFGEQALEAWDRARDHT
jgi:hypothetical protein